MSRVGRALGYTDYHLDRYPELAAHVEMVAERHNAQRRQRRYDELAARVAEALEEARRGLEPITMRQVIRQVGLSYARLQLLYPELHKRVREVVEAERAAQRLALRQRHCVQINTAAAHLIEQGIPLTYTGLLKAAGVDRYYGFRNAIIHSLLEQWIGESTPGAST